MKSALRCPGFVMADRIVPTVWTKCTAPQDHRTVRINSPVEGNAYLNTEFATVTSIVNRVKTNKTAVRFFYVIRGESQMNGHRCGKLLSLAYFADRTHRCWLIANDHVRKLFLPHRNQTRWLSAAVFRWVPQYSSLNYGNCWSHFLWTEQVIFKWNQVHDGPYPDSPVLLSHNDRSLPHSIRSSSNTLYLNVPQGILLKIVYTTVPSSNNFFIHILLIKSF